VFADQLGPFGSTVVRLEPTRILMVVISFLETLGLDDVLQRTTVLLEPYAAAKKIETGVAD